MNIKDKDCYYVTAGLLLWLQNVSAHEKPLLKYSQSISMETDLAFTRQKQVKKKSNYMLAFFMY